MQTHRMSPCVKATAPHLSRSSGDCNTQPEGRWQRSQKTLELAKDLRSVHLVIREVAHVPPDFSGRRIRRDSPWQAHARIFHKGLFVVLAAEPNLGGLLKRPTRDEFLTQTRSFAESARRRSVAGRVQGSYRMSKWTEPG